jgi:hypothetical protein
MIPDSRETPNHHTTMSTTTDKPKPEKRVSAIEPGYVYRSLSGQFERDGEKQYAWSYGIADEEGRLCFVDGGVYPADWIDKAHYYIEVTEEPFAEYAERVARGRRISEAHGEWCAANGYPD